MAEEIFEGEFYEGSTDQSSGHLPVQFLSQSPEQVTAGLMQTKTSYHQAVDVIKPRVMATVERNIMQMAILLGDSAFYGWGSGKNHVEGGTIYLAAVMFHAMGNVAVEANQVQSTPEEWIFTHTYIDVERGTSLPRQFMQQRREPVPGNMDQYRKAQVNFGKGQSKGIRNLIFMNTPRYLVKKAIEAAKQGARTKMKKFIDENTLAAAQDYTLAQLAKVGVKEEHVLAKIGKAKVEALDIDDLVKLSADFKAIQNGDVNASEIFDLAKPATTGVDLKDKLKSKVENVTTVGKQVDSASQSSGSTQVREGAKPFTWFVNDGLNEYLVSETDGIYTCNCKPKCTDCTHVSTTREFVAQQQ